METIERVINDEWEMFAKTQNVGGRANCQSNRPKFFVMRRCQFSAWPDVLVESYLSDLKEARLNGRNLIAEKYGYMMAQTYPAEYAMIADQLPEISDEKRKLIEEICAYQKNELEALTARYPVVTSCGRPVTQGKSRQAAFETYLFGELATYSLTTVNLYKRFVKLMHRNGLNLTERILTNEMQAYGYRSLDDAEQALNKQRQA
jgi:hypothetical protein